MISLLFHFRSADESACGCEMDKVKGKQCLHVKQRIAKRVTSEGSINIAATTIPSRLLLYSLRFAMGVTVGGGIAPSPRPTNGITANEIRFLLPCLHPKLTLQWQMSDVHSLS